MEDFARRLPKLRKRVAAGLDGRGLSFEKVCSCAVALLDLGLFRVGSERYENDNESYGLTTLQCRHLSFEAGEAIFDYPSKSGQRGHHTIASQEVVAVLKKLKQRGKPGSSLFEFYEGREWRELNSEHVNAYIKEVAGEGFSAKDFRTWNATVLCAVHLAIHAPEEDEKPSKARRKRIANLAVRETAEYLNNTPAVCRASYVDPRVFDRFEAGETIGPALQRIERGVGPGAFLDREKIERAVLKLL